MSIVKRSVIALIAVVTLSTTTVAGTDWQDRYRAKYGRSLQKEQQIDAAKQKQQAVKSASCVMACCKSCS
jgi:high-affinity Fe2+/Pb2+ permease